MKVIPQTDASFATNGFRFLLSGPMDMLVVVESSSDLSHWKPLLTNQTRGGPAVVEVNDRNATNSNQRFYRARSAE
jgi:hypothetical protein